MGRGETTTGNVSGAERLRGSPVPEQVRRVGASPAGTCHRARPLGNHRARRGVSPENAEVLPRDSREFPLVTGELGSSNVRDPKQVSESTNEHTRSLGRGEGRYPERGAGTGTTGPSAPGKRPPSHRGAACARLGRGP